MLHSTLAPRSRLAGKRHSFFVGLVQMVLVSINLKNITNGNLIYSMVFTVINTLFLQYAARTIIHSTFSERVVNALGSATGVAIGIAIHYFIIKPNAFFHLATVIR